MPEPIPEGTWRSLQRWALGASVVLGPANVVVRLLAPDDQGFDVSALDTFLVSNQLCHLGNVLLNAVLLARPFSERAARAGAMGTMVLGLGTSLGALWLLGSVTNVTNVLFFAIIVAAARALLDARIGLWTLGCAAGMHSGLVALELGGVLQPHAFLPDIADPYYDDPTAHVIALCWILAVYAFAWGLAGLAALRFRDSEHALVLVNASLEERVRAQVDALQRSERLRRYLAPQLVDQLLGAEESPGLSRERAPLTVFFCDLRGFTPLVEQLDASDLAELLNRYLDVVASIAFDHGGTIDKFIGDAVMVFFGAPTRTDPRDQARRCVRMAIEVQEALQPLRREAAQRWGADLAVRVGIASGTATVGDFGSRDRMEYTAVGSPVNRAARLEPQAPPNGILVDDATRALAQGEGIVFDPHGELQLRGIAQPVIAWTVRRDPASLPPSRDAVRPP